MLSRLQPVLLIAASNAVCRICAKSVPKSLPPMASRRHLSGGAVLSAPRCPAMRRGGCFLGVRQAELAPLASGIALSGSFLYGEPLTADKPAGAAVCLFGPCLIIC